MLDIQSEHQLTLENILEIIYVNFINTIEKIIDMHNSI